MSHAETQEMSAKTAKSKKGKEKGKGKGKENSVKGMKPNLKASRNIFATAIPVGSTDGINAQDVDSAWPWTTLADSFASTRPAVFTADGNYFFSVVGTSVRIYSAASGKVVSTLSSSSTGSSGSHITSGEGHTDVITAATLNPENPYQLLTASLDGDIKIWDFLDAVLLQTIHIGKPISHMCTHDNFKGHVFIAVLTKLKKNRSATSSLEKGNTMIYRISLKPRETSLSRTPRSSEIVRIGKSKAAVSMSVSPSGSWLVVIAGYKAYVSPTLSPESGFTKFVSPETLTCLAFHPSDDYFATGDEQGQIRLWYCLNNQIPSNSTNGERRAQTTTMHWHAHAVSSLAFTPNGAYLISGGEESVLVIWQLHSGKREFVPRLGSPILNVSVRGARESDEEYLVGLADGSYVFVNAGSLSVTRAISRIRLDPKGIGRPPHTPVPLALHAKSSTIILPASHPSSLQIYSPGSSVLLSELEVSPSNRISRRDEKPIEASRVDYVTVSASGEWMATMDNRQSNEDFSAEIYLKIWQWESSAWVLNTRIDRPHGSKALVSMKFSPKVNSKVGELLMTAGLDGKIKTWSIRSSTSKSGKDQGYWISRSCFSYRKETPSDACWSPDSSLLVVCFSQQIAVYDPSSNLLLDCLIATEVKKPRSVSFVGRSGRFLLVSARNTAVLWDLVSRSVRWHYHSALEIVQAIPHPDEDVVAIIVQPYAEEGAIRTSKVLLLKPSSSKPFEIRSLPFRFRAVIWFNNGGSSRTLVGVTYSWNVVLCGDNARISIGAHDAPREIDLSIGAFPRKTLFQDIFGKSAFSATTSLPSTAPPLVGVSNRIGRDVLSTFDAPAYLAPPIESLYSSLMDELLITIPNREMYEDDERPEEEEEMVIDSEIVQPVLASRTVDDKEIESLVALFQTHSFAIPAKSTNIPNGITTNGKHKIISDAMRSSTPQTPNTTHSNGKLKGIGQNAASSAAVSSRPSSPVATGKKRKKSLV